MQASVTWRLKVTGFCTCSESAPWTGSCLDSRFYLKSWRIAEVQKVNRMQFKISKLYFRPLHNNNITIFTRRAWSTWATSLHTFISAHYFIKYACALVMFNPKKSPPSFLWCLVRWDNLSLTWDRSSSKCQQSSQSISNGQNQVPLYFFCIWEAVLFTYMS